MRAHALRHFIAAFVLCANSVKMVLFHCSMCSKSFTRKDGLVRHSKLHNAISYNCELCSETYSRKDNLKRHAYRVHGVPLEPSASDQPMKQQLHKRDAEFHTDTKDDLCCVCRTSSKLASHFQFPHPNNDEDRFDKWIMAIGKQRFKGLSKEDIYRSLKVCARHFSPKHILAPSRFKFMLHKEAIPCLMLGSVEKTEENSSTSPPTTIKPKEDKYLHCPKNDERISLILNKKFTFLQKQVPLKITDDEYKVMQEIISNDDVFKDATLFTKVHCTLCDTHLGTAPIAQFDRFVHPVLNTLTCESCFVFYNTAELIKDEDGNENYCNWCAKRGTFICCSDCPLLFCKVCVERNFGESVWEKIANSNNWVCFKCNFSQLSKLRIMCSAVYEYTLQIIDKAIRIGDKDLLEKDISICCKEDSTITKKRKHIVLADGVNLENIRFALRKRLKVSHDLDESLSTPGDRITAKKSAPSTPKATSPHPPPIVASSSPAPLVPVVSAPAALKPVIPVITRVEGNVGHTSYTPNEESTNNANTATRIFSCVEDGLWLKNCLDASQEVMETFMIRSKNIRQAIKSPKNQAQYAELQKSMHNALNQCWTMMLETQKVLAFDYETFLADSNMNIRNSEKVPARVYPAANKTAVTSVDGAGGKNSTIILRNNETNILTPVLQMPPECQAPILLRPTLTPITATGLKPVLLNQVHPMKAVRLVNANVKNYSVAISQVGSTTVGNIVPSSMVSAGPKNMHVEQIIHEKKTDKDPLAMSDDESSSILQNLPQPVLWDESSIKAEIDTFIDDSITIKDEEDET